MLSRQAFGTQEPVDPNRPLPPNEQIVAAYSEELYRIYVYSWSMGSAAFETGLTLAHLVFEKQPYGAPHTHAML